MQQKGNDAQPSPVASLQQMPSAALQAVLAFSPDALLCVTQAGIIVQINEQAA